MRKDNTACELESLARSPSAHPSAASHSSIAGPWVLWPPWFLVFPATRPVPPSTGHWYMQVPVSGTLNSCPSSLESTARAVLLGGHQPYLPDPTGALKNLTSTAASHLSYQFMLVDMIIYLVLIFPIRPYSPQEQKS